MVLKRHLMVSGQSKREDSWSKDLEARELGTFKEW